MRCLANPAWQRVVNPGMDEALTADLPAAELVEVLIASRALPGPHRDPRLMLAAGLVVATIAFGISSHAISGERTAPTRSGPASIATDTGAGEPGGVSGSPAVADVALAEATDLGPARGATFVIAGSARVPIRDAWLGVRAGRIVLGARSTDLAAGAFSIGVPVFPPNVPVAVAVEVRATGPAGPVLATSASSLMSGPTVDVWSIVARQIGDACRVTAIGPAPIAVGAVHASLTDRGATVATGRAPIAAAADSPAGASLHLGRWRFEVSLASGAPAQLAAAARTLRLELAWHDPSDGTSSELSVPFGGCATA
jgi:hypothetical protein